jgi:hypothetical protein
MPINPNFSSTESLSTPSQITFTDISTGSDGTLTVRHLYIQLANGNYLTESGESATPTYTVWDYSAASITLDLLTESTVGNCTVIWLAGTSEVTNKTILMIWDLYDYIFTFGLIQTQTSSPTIISDTNYFSNYLQMIVNLFSAETAVTDMTDIYSSQSALNRNQNFINNQNLYF